MQTMWRQLRLRSVVLSTLIFSFCLFSLACLVLLSTLSRTESFHSFIFSLLIYLHLEGIDSCCDFRNWSFAKLFKRLNLHAWATKLRKLTLTSEIYSIESAFRDQCQHQTRWLAYTGFFHIRRIYPNHFSPHWLKWKYERWSL